MENGGEGALNYCLNGEGVGVFILQFSSVIG